MKPTLLPISLCHTICKSCGLPTEFHMFESGAGGEFSTYVGRKTKNIYRVNLSKAQYLGNPLNEILLPAIATEGGIENLSSIPEQVQCKVCHAIFSAESCTSIHEEKIYAFQL